MWPSGAMSLRNFSVASVCALALVVCTSHLSSLQQQVECQQFQLNATASAPTSTANQNLDRDDTSPFDKIPALTKTSDPIGDVVEQLVQQQAQDTLSSSMLKTFIRTNNMRAYHLDLHSYRSQAKFSGDPKFVSSLNAEHKSRCSRHLRAYEQALKSFKEFDPIVHENSIDLMRLADVFGRPEAGVLTGNQFWLGSYDSCLDIKMRVGAGEQVQSQYCLGVAQFPNWNPQDGKTSIKVGLCLPETCTSSMLSDDDDLLQRVEVMMKSSFGSGSPYDKIRLRHVYCLPHETSEVRKFSWSAICYFALIGSLVSLSLIATVIDHYERKHRAEDHEQQVASPQQRHWRTIVVESFSISRNWDRLTHIHPTSTSDDQTIVDENNVMGTYDRSRFLSSINGLKCLGLIWIIAAHTFLVAPIPDKNLINMDKTMETYLASVYMAAHLMVDTFFALSGLVASFFVFKDGIGKIKTSHWVVLTIHRYWRLTPLYIICYWFTKSVGHLVNSGPLWDHMTAEKSPRLNCFNEPWSEALLHLSDFKSPKDHCVPFAWFIANGIKFWIVTPFLLLAIHKSIRRGYTTILSAICANVVLVGFLAYNSSVDVKAVLEVKPESADNMLDNMGQVYTRPYSRIGAYLVGLLAGHLIYLVDSNQFEIRISKNAKIIAWTLFSTVVLVLAFLLKIAGGVKLDETAMRWVFSISSALIRPIWAVATCWLVIALAHGQVRWLSRFLSANVWQVMVKLSFCGYLIQGEVLAQIYLAKTSSETFNYIDLISRPIVTITLTVLVSSIMVVLFELPLVGIEELILPKRHKSSGAIKHDHQQSESSKLLKCNKLKST